MQKARAEEEARQTRLKGLKEKSKMMMIVELVRIGEGAREKGCHLRQGGSEPILLSSTPPCLPRAVIIPSPPLSFLR